MQRLSHTPAPHTCTIHIQPLRQLTNTQFSFTVLNTICSSIIRIQPNTPEDEHIDARNMHLFIIINKLLHQVGISRQFNN